MGESPEEEKRRGDLRADDDYDPVEVPVDEIL